MTTRSTTRSTMPREFKRYVKTIGKLDTAAELAQHFDVSQMTIYNWMKLAGIEKLKAPRINAVDKREIKRLIKLGLGTEAIYRKMKCSKSTVIKFKRKMRLERENGIA